MLAPLHDNYTDYILSHHNLGGVHNKWGVFSGQLDILISQWELVADSSVNGFIWLVFR